MSVKSQYLLNISARHQMNSRYKITGLQVYRQKCAFGRPFLFAKADKLSFI